MQQYLIPPNEYLQCEECFKIVSYDMSRKSKERCHGHVLCFKHQMHYTSNQYRFKRLAKRQQAQA